MQRFGWFRLRQQRLWQQRLWLGLFLGCVTILVGISGCSLPQVQPEDRLFLNLSLDYLGAIPFPPEFSEPPVGGLSGLTYDRSRNQFYAISDDRSQYAPARFYTLQLNWHPNWQPNQLLEAEATGANASQNPIGELQISQATILRSETGEPFAAGTIDGEGIALSPRQTLFIASEGDRDRGIAPSIEEFDLATGAWLSRLPIPNRYLPRTENDRPIGVQNNQAFESLTLSATRYENATRYGNTLEPFRIFAATESALWQDLRVDDGNAGDGNAGDGNAGDGNETAPSTGLTPIRFMHYLVGEQTLLLAEHLYAIDALPDGAENLGLSELLVLDQGGHLLSLERSFGLTGFGIRIFQLALGGATDIAPIPALAGDLAGITPIQKRLLLDLSTLGIRLDNYEGMTLGPQLPDGSQSLILMSDDNFNPLQTSELLVFRLRSES